MIPGSRSSPGEEMATHSCILAWRSDGQGSLATVHGVTKELDMTNNSNVMVGSGRGCGESESLWSSKQPNSSQL